MGQHGILPNQTLRDCIETWIEGPRAENAFPFCFVPEDFAHHSRPSIKIQDGCDNHCTFCRVRLARGKSVSLEPEKVLQALGALEEKGCAEAVLTGVNITQYRDGTHDLDLAGLLEYLLAGTSRIAIRLSSLEPEGITEKFAKIAAHPRIRPHFHLSIQSASAEILKKMGRPYDSELLERCLALLRLAKEDPFLACDIITGFPGESDAEFEKTHQFCRKAGFAWIHAFPYSPRPGTAALSFGGTVSEREAGERVAALMGLARNGRREYTKRWIGKKLDVVIESGEEKNLTFCRGVSDNYLRIGICFPPGKRPHAGTALKCRLESLNDEDTLPGAFEADALAVPVDGFM
jgi:threonylcarbamoyladenosine tRNA methylthiotransferase MtaB